MIAAAQDRERLDADLIAAHACGDGPSLAHLYRDAGLRANDRRGRAFYLTHAMVFALEAGMPQAEDIRETLRRMGSEP